MYLFFRLLLDGAVHLVTGLESFTLLDWLSGLTLGQAKLRDVVEFLTKLVGAILNYLNLGQEGTPCLDHDCSVYIINHSVDFESLTQIIGLLLCEDHTAQSLKFTL